MTKECDKIVEKKIENLKEYYMIMKKEYDEYKKIYKDGIEKIKKKNEKL